MRVWTTAAAVVVLSCLPAIAQATDTCAGQPSVDGSTTGSQGLSFNPLVGNINPDTISVGGGACVDVAGLDSVTCFTPASSCTPTFTYISSVGQTVSMSVITGPQCSVTAGPCDVGSSGSASNGAAVVVDTVNLGLGFPVCIYFSGNNSSPTGFTMSNAAACGQLPVEIQQFVIDDQDQAEDEQD